VLAIKAVTDALPDAGALTTIQADLDNIQARIPAALVSGRIDASVGAMAAAVITAASIAADAITDAKVASDVTIASVTGAVGSVTGSVGSVTGAVGSVTGAVGSVAAGGITAASIATDAIDADSIAANAVTEIQSGLATAADLATVAAFVDTEVAAIKAVTDLLFNGGALTTIQADLDDLQTRVPAALVGGKIDANIGALGAGSITAATIATGAIDADALAADAVSEIQSGLATAAALATVGADVLAVFDQAIEGSLSARQSMRLFLSALAGKLSGAATTTISIRDTGDTKDRIIATVDADGNRTAMTLDAT